MLLIYLEHLINILVGFFGYNLFPKYMNTCKNLRNLIEDCACTFCLNFLSYPCNLPNPCSLPGSSAINLNWTLKHIILEIFEIKFLKLVSSYYCLTKTLIKSIKKLFVFLKICCDIVLQWKVQIITFQIKTKFTWKIID